jgi:hypothetical protein
MQYSVVGVRISLGENTNEGAFDTEARALARLDALADDLDCLLAEVEYIPNASGFQKISVIAQAERIHGEWRKVTGELRKRTRGSEARELLNNTP